MPPPKKPKNGPTSVEQFLSREELQRMEETATGEILSRVASDGVIPAAQRKIASAGCDNGNDDCDENKTCVSSPFASAFSAPAVGVKNMGGVLPMTIANTAGSAVLGAVDGSGLSNNRFRLLRQLFVQQDMDLHGQLPSPGSRPAVSQVPPVSELKKGLNGDAGTGVSEAGRVGIASQAQWALGRGHSGKLTLGVADCLSTASLQPPRSGSGRAGGGVGGGDRIVQGSSETLLSTKCLMERTYLTSLIKESPPVSSGATFAASYLERAALTSGKLLHGLMGAPAPPTYIHAAFQLPLLDTHTSGHHAAAGPASTSVLAYLATTTQGTHQHHQNHPHPSPHSPRAPFPHLPRCGGPSSSSLPLVEASTTSSSLTSLTPSPASSSSGGVSSTPAAQAGEPFDLSVKKMSANGNSMDCDSAAGGGGGGGDPACSNSSCSSSSRPGSSAGSELLSSATFITSANNSSTSMSPAVASTPPARGERDGSSSPALPRGITPTHYLTDLKGPGGLSASSPLAKAFGLDASNAGSGSASAAAAAAALAALGSRSFPRTARTSPGSPIREPAESKGSGGDNSQGHIRLASSATPGPLGAGPGGGAGPEAVREIPGMPGHSFMSSSGHLQAPTSTTPEGSGVGLAPSFMPMEPPIIKTEIPPASSTPAKVCQVCNDNASGFHYGVWSCEGCKAFFKRSIQGPVDYMCPATNNCTIDKHRRKSCQACRLRKCYEVGMNKGSQRKERKSSGSSSPQKGKRCRADSTDTAVNSTNIGGGASASKSQRRSQCAFILEALQKADLPVIESSHNHDLPLTRVHLLNTLVKLADRELVYLINWAKHVPGYTDLSLSDQVHLIECCWMELLLLNCAFRSMDFEGKHLAFAPDFHLDRQLWVVMGMKEILEQVSAVTEQMVGYGVTKEELLLLKATILVNAEVRRLESFNKIVEMRNMIVDTLMEVAHKSHPDDPRRVPTLLLLLTHVRQAGERGIAYFQTLKRAGSVTFCDLLTEMLDAHNPSTATVVTSSSIAMTATMPSTSSSGTNQKMINAPSPHMPHGPS